MWVRFKGCRKERKRESAHKVNIPTAVTGDKGEKEPMPESEGMRKKKAGEGQND